MSDRPINMSAVDVRALLAGRKTQTRRILKPPACITKSDDPNHWDVSNTKAGGIDFVYWPADEAVIVRRSFPYAVGDQLWVRENIWQSGAWVRTEDETGEIGSKWVGTRSIRMMADEEKPAGAGNFVWRSIPSIHMPRWASRLTLVVEGVKVERLQDISEEDAKAEGVTADDDPFWRPSAFDPDSGGSPSHRNSFEYLWDSINGDGAWDANPFVVAITFSVHRTNIDAMEKPHAVA